jgi:hypothetical protein
MGIANSPIATKIGPSSTQILSPNPKRTGLAVVNVSENIISLSFGHPAVLNGGITLLPGAAFNMDQFLFTTQAMNAIATATGSALSVQEFQ